MKKSVFVLITVVLLAVPVLAQTPVPPPPPPLVPDDVVKISTTLIQVNAIVTDNKGNPIKDLKPEDFEIYENGRKQEITNVSFIGAGENSIEAENFAKSNKNKKIPLPVTQNELKPEEVRRTIILAVDDLNLSAESIYYVRRSLRKFVDEQMQAGDLVAIVRMGGGIGALQQFTADKRQLYAAIEKVRFNPRGSGGLFPFAPIEPDSLEQANAGGLGASDLERGKISKSLRDDLINSQRASIQRSNDFQQNSNIAGTLEGLTYIIRGMHDLPGRKSIMLFSDGFQLFSPRIDNYNVDNREALKRLADAASRSSVVVYSLEASGLQTLGVTAADNVPAGVDGAAYSQALRTRGDILFRTQEGLLAVSEITGGFAVLNRNNLNSGIRKILNDQSYYLIAYQPNEEIFDPNKLKFNNLEIKVKRNDVKVRYSTGFFGITDETIEEPINPTPYQQLSAALTSPFVANGITLNLNTVFRSDANYNYFLNSFLYIGIKDLNFSDEPDKTKKAVFDLLAVSFGDNGVPVDAVSKTYTINLKSENYQKLLNEGFIYNFTFPVKKSGAYQMRVAIRDHATEKVGSASQFVEVPQLDKKRLTLSGLVIENLSRQLWEKDNSAVSVDSELKKPDALSDTALRVFKKGTVLHYGFEIYNAKNNAGQTPKLQIRTRVFREGKLIFEGKPKPIDTTGQNAAKIIKADGAINIGDEMQTGDYILQIIVTDDWAKEKYDTASQFVQFEVIE